MIGSILLIIAAVLISEAWWWGATLKNRPGCRETRPVAVVFYAGSAAEDYRRLEAAFDLVRNDCANAIALVGGDRPERGFNGSEANVPVLLALGIKPERILRGAGSFDSRTNLEESSRI